MTELLLENNQDEIELNDELISIIQSVCDKALETEDCDFDAQVSVTLTDNEEIRKINSEFRNIDKETDVLSFPMLEFDENGNIDDCDFEEDPESGNIILGDIIISTQRAREQANEFGHSIKREIAFLCAHSMLHLLGYDHVDDPIGEKIMIEKQENILNSLGITRDIK